jgi:hypothetical protein
MPCRADGLGTGVGPMTDEDYKKMEYQSGGYVNNTIKSDKLKLQEMEEDLCIVRDLLFKMIDDRKLPDNIDDILFDQLNKHKEHRKEDFEDTKNYINKSIDYVNHFIKILEKYYKRHYENEQDFYTKYAITYESLKKLKKDKKLINKMSFDDFWKDRYLFNEYKKKNPSY